MPSAIVLAAGQSRRMGRFKLLLPWNGRTVIGQVVATLEAAGVDDIVVVTGHHAADVEASLAGTSARTAHNPEYARGEMIGSIQTGLRALDSGAMAVLLCLGDQPQMEVPTVIAVLAAGAQAGWEQIIIPSYEMRAGHPILLPSAAWPVVLSTAGSLRDALRDRRDTIHYLAVETASVLADLDTPEDYETQQGTASGER